MITYTYDLDVTPGGVPLSVHASQYDGDSRTFVFRLFSSAGELSLPSAAEASVKGTKPDGNGFSYTAERSGNNVTVQLTKQMTAVAGHVRCEIVINLGETELATANFILVVERAALDKDTLISGSEIREIIEITDRTDEILAAARSMEQSAASVETNARSAAASAQSASESKQSAAQSLTSVQQKAREIAAIKTEADLTAAQALEKATNAENEVAENQNTLDALQRNDEAMQLLIEGKIDGAYVESGYLYLTSNDEIVAGPLGPFSGGGGGGGGEGGNNAQITVTNAAGWLSKTVASDEDVTIVVNWSSIEDDMPTGNGSMKITVNGAVKAILEVAQGEVRAEISSYLTVGSNVVKVNVSDMYGNNRTVNYSVTVVALSVSSPFDDTAAYTGPISFGYVPVGNVQKTVHFILDGDEIGSTVTSVSGRQQSFTIPQQTHGPHTFSCYFDAVINGQTVRSNELYYEIICLEVLNDTPIIVSDYHETTVKQYASMHIGYSVYDPVSMTADVVISVNGRTVSEQTVDRSRQTFTYRADDTGELVITIRTGAVTKTVTVMVEESDIHVDPESDSLVLYLSSYGRSNNEETRNVWEYENISASLTGFNYTSDGWKADEDGNTVLRVSGDARVTIPYHLFGTDFRTSGKTIEIEFATRDVMDYDAVILSCLSGGRGLSMTAQKASFFSEQSAISTQFKEDEHVRIAFVTEKRTEHRLIYCYINGIMSGTIQYPVDDDFAQTTPVDISIGSNDCTMDIYCIRVYNNDLTRHQILTNWIADTQNVDEMLDRYQRNSVYDDYGNVVIAQLPHDLPYLILECPELPQYKGDKKIVSGSYTDPVAPGRSFTFTGAQFDVQGTSSQYYERKNYKGKFKEGFIMASGSTASKYKLREDSIPVSTFCFKADVASSEGANNVELVRLYNDACSYKTPAQREDARIRQGIDGFPIVIFWNNGTDVIFMGKYNWNNDKSTEETFGFQEGDESWEVLNNTGDRVLFKSADYSGTDWLNDFEARFPDTDPAYTDPAQLREFAEWIVSTDTERATGETLPSPVTYDDVTFASDTAAYRIAKFKAEAGNYMELQSAMFYYLFTELFLMVDSRAKNMFPSFMGGNV